MKTPSCLFSPSVVLSLAFLVLGGLQQQASATTYSWVNAKITNWSDTTGWSGGIIPVSNQDTILSFSVSLNSTATNDLGTVQLNRLVASNSSSSNKNLTVAGSSVNNLNFVKNSSNALPTFAIANNSVSGALTVSIPFTVTDALTITNSGSKGSSISGAITNTGGITFDGAGAGSITLGAGVVSGGGALTQNGAYTLIMTGANTYTGDTTIGSGATLQVGNSGTVGKIATGSAIINNGTLAFKRTNAVAQGTDFSGAAITGTGALTQAGTSTLTLNAANTYSGNTTVSAGTLALGVANAVSSSSDVVLGGGILQSAFSQTLGTLNLTASSTLDLSTGGTFTFADSSSLAGSWTGTLSIVGTFTNTSVQFGTSSGGLTSGQLSQITINGGAAAIDGSGFLTLAIPEPSTYAALAGSAMLGLAAWRRSRRSVAKV